MLSVPAVKPHSPQKAHFSGEDHTETRLMPSLGAQQMVFRLGEDDAKACVVLSLPVYKPWSPERDEGEQNESCGDDPSSE